MAGRIKGLFPNFAFATIVRDPFSRAISQYFYERCEADALGIEKSKRPIPGEVTAPEFWDTFLRWGSAKLAGAGPISTCKRER